MLKRTGKPGNEFMKQICYRNINYHITEPDWHRQNPNEEATKKATQRVLKILDSN